MAEVTITRNSELMIAQAQGETEEALDFIDAYIPSREGAEFTVVDAGRILLHEKDLADFEEAAKKEGLTIEREEQLGA